MRKGLFVIIIFSLLLLACENRTPKARKALMDYETGVVQRKPDTVVQRKAKKADGKGKTERVKPSSTLSDKPSNDDNMRGFDPASEDDLPDNGMSRYMENNDDEGWE